MINITSEIYNRLALQGQFALTEILELTSEGLKQLGDEELEELDSFTNLRRQREYISSRLVLKEMAKNLGAKDLTIGKDKLGQPFGVSDKNKYHVSIAHTEKMVLCGISDAHAIGVDIEPIGRKGPEKLKQRILHPNETEPFADMESIRLWTIKEAYVKLRGQGLRLNMDQIWIQQEGEDYFVELNNDKTAKICSFQKDNHWLAIAYFFE